MKGRFHRIGSSVLAFFQGTGEAITLLVQTIYWLRAVPHSTDKIAYHIFNIGNRTLPIAAMLSLFIGGVLALQTGMTLADYGIQPMIGGIVGLAMVKELGPVMMAILVAGRVGSAMAAELAAMSVYQEVDALRTMNINVVRFLVMPRVTACVFALPLLVLFSDTIGWIGGAVVSSSNAKIGVSFHLFFRNVEQFVDMGDVGNGLVKAAVFALLVSIICCYVGLSTRGGPREVGAAVTRAVVLSFVYILIFDYVITRLLL